MKRKVDVGEIVAELRKSGYSHGIICVSNTEHTYEKYIWGEAKPLAYMLLSVENNIKKAFFSKE